MTKTFLNGFDFDNAELADYLRTLADGIDGGSVALKTVATSEHVGIDDPSTFNFEVEYHTELTDLPDPITYTEDNE